MNKRLRLSIALLWILVVLYPNPLMFFATLWRTISFPVDVEAVQALAAELPDNPNTLHNLVLSELAVYDHDWNVYDVPWYFPSVAEVVRDRRGDCESQASLLASILEAKGIPYQLKMSFDHMWIDYRSKKSTAIEHDDLAFMEQAGTSLKLKMPKQFDPKNFMNTQLDARWHPMPDHRKIMLFVGLPLILIGPTVLRLLGWLKTKEPVLQG